MSALSRQRIDERPGEQASGFRARRHLDQKRRFGKAAQFRELGLRDHTRNTVGGIALHLRQ